MYDPGFDQEPTLGQCLATFNSEVATAVSGLADRVDGVAGRLVGAEAAHRAFQEDARAALDGLLGQARAEFERQSSALLVLRSDAQREILEGSGTWRRLARRSSEGTSTRVASSPTSSGPWGRTIGPSPT